MPISCSIVLTSRRVLRRPDLSLVVGRHLGPVHRNHHHQPQLRHHHLRPSSHRAATPSPEIGTIPAQLNRHTKALQIRAMSASAPSELRFKNPAILVCDIQDKFRSAIYEFDKIVLTTQKLLRFSKSFSVPVITTTQTSAKLGPTVPELASMLPAPPHDKTRFSMCIPAVQADLSSGPAQVALVGIESHICITQTALDLRDAGHSVYVIADGVSSCNPAEVGIALDRLRSEPGITVTSSESWMYECVGDASHPGFKSLINVVKGSMADTKKVWEVLPPAPKI